jgi:hypothetical protein
MTDVRLHIYRLPDALNDGYCFGGGNPIPFQNVDFFDVACACCSVKLDGAGQMRRDQIEEFIRTKRYFDPAARFLILSPPGHPALTFTIEPAG